MAQEILATEFNKSKNILLWESKVADIQLSWEGAAQSDWMNHPLAFSISAWTLTLASCLNGLSSVLMLLRHEEFLEFLIPG